MDADCLVFVNGEMVPMKGAKISVYDRGLQYGDAVFEGIRAYEGRIFKLREHVERLYRFAAAVNIKISLTKTEFYDAIKRVVRENKFTDAHIKPQVTRGIARNLGLDPRNTTEPNTIITARPIGKSMVDSSKGFRLASVSVRKIPPMCLDPRIKSCNYLVNILARAEAIASGADEAVMLDIQGYVSEGCGDNIFLVKNGELCTPPAQDALEGITRQTIMELAARMKLICREVKLTLYDLYTADEAFITGSGAGVVPVTVVDERQVSGGQPGEMTISRFCDEETQKGGSAYDR